MYYTVQCYAFVRVLDKYGFLYVYDTHTYLPPQGIFPYKTDGDDRHTFKG